MNGRKLKLTASNLEQSLDKRLTICPELVLCCADLLRQRAYFYRQEINVNIKNFKNFNSKLGRYFIDILYDK